MRELILVLSDPDKRTFMEAAAPSAQDVRSIERVLAEQGAVMQPLFRGPAGPPKETLSRAGGPVYYSVAADDDRLEELAELVRGRAEVEGAYVKPAAEPPNLNSMTPSAMTPPIITPDFSPRQGYLEPSSAGGVDARHAWTWPGGTGEGVRIIDMEWGWTLDHESLPGMRVVLGPNDSAYYHHGTAVVGVIAGSGDGFGIQGIAPGARMGVASFSSTPTARAIDTAAAALSSGDILLLEIHRPGPGQDFAQRHDQLGYIPIEWWPDDFEAIRRAVQRGIIVVEAAGNGAQDLDDPVYQSPAPGFPPSWRNPLTVAGPDSGAVLVGAGAPPSSNHGPARSRLPFSNFGSRVDVQGWGREVVTAGYGDLQGGHRTRHYTDAFSGTSSASPIVVGVLACAQGVALARRELLTPGSARDLVRTHVAPQPTTSTENIGGLPDLRQLIPHV